MEKNLLTFYTIVLGSIGETTGIPNELDCCFSFKLYYGHNVIDFLVLHF